SRDVNSLRIYLRIQNGAGKAWFDNLSLKQIDYPMKNVLITESSPLVVKSFDQKTIYIEGKDYEISPGETKFPYSIENKPWKIRLLPESRIKEDEKILISYNYAPPDSINYCPSEPGVYEIMEDAVSNTIKFLDPRYIHIGHDEPGIFNSDSRCIKRGMSNASLFAYDINRIYNTARKYSSEIKLMMWADGLNPYHNARSHNLSSAVEKIPEDIIMCIWYYEVTPSSINWERKSLQYFLKKGFKVTGSPWYKIQNCIEWAGAIKDTRTTDKNCLGIIYTSWRNSWQGLEKTSQLGWNGQE
ncbi:MAG: family 20 glycosylhydrolase, partial [Thermotogota bacterium]|nr:family 20 glycosylhydrolase [Thermotogota bacterium]